MNKLIKLFDLNKASFIIILLPYLGFNFKEIYNSPFFNTIVFLGLIGVFILIEILFKLANNKFSRFGNLITAFTVSVSLIFFYGVYLATYLQSFTIHTIKDRVILIPAMIIIFLLLIFKKKHQSFKVFNAFFIVFGLVTFSLNSIFIIENLKNINIIQNSYTQLQKKYEDVKPIILLNTDEYYSPVGLYNDFKY